MSRLSVLITGAVLVVIGAFVFPGHDMAFLVAACAWFALWMLVRWLSDPGDRRRAPAMRRGRGDGAADGVSPMLYTTYDAGHAGGGHRDSPGGAQGHGLGGAQGHGHDSGGHADSHGGGDGGGGHGGDGGGGGGDGGGDGGS